MTQAIHSPVRTSFAWQLAVNNPGHMYNVGNLVAFAGALGIFALQIKLARGDQSLWQHLFGTLEATATSLATLVFWIGGRKYATAWVRGFPPEERANRAGHVLSCFGAILIGVVLVRLAATETALALSLIATILHVGGKLGSWLAADQDRHFKPMPFYSRIPYAATLMLDLRHGFLTDLEGQAWDASMLMPAMLIVATIFWARADWVLLDGKS